MLSVPIFWVKRSENEITHIKVGGPHIALQSESDLGGGLCFAVLPIMELLGLADLAIHEAVQHPDHFLHSLGKKCHSVKLDLVLGKHSSHPGVPGGQATHKQEAVTQDGAEFRRKAQYLEVCFTHCPPWNDKMGMTIAFTWYLIRMIK